MKKFVKTALVAFSLLVSTGVGFAADAKSTAKPAADAAKVDAKAAIKDTAAGKTADTKAPAIGALIDINSATDAELKAVPGIGAAYAAKIIAGRPYANKTQLKSRTILPAALYEQVKDRLIAKQKK